MKTTIIISTAALLVSFDISYVVAKTKKPHTTWETVLQPAAIKIWKNMHGENHSQALKEFLISKNTMAQWNESMSEDINEKLPKKN